MVQDKEKLKKENDRLNDEMKNVINGMGDNWSMESFRKLAELSGKIQENTLEAFSGVEVVIKDKKGNPQKLVLPNIDDVKKGK